MNAAEQYGKEMSEIHEEAYAVAAICLFLYARDPREHYYVGVDLQWFFW